VVELTESHRTSLLAEAQPLGERVYAERGKRIRERWGAYWAVAAKAITG
jgi:hypothetical protein